MLGKRKLDETNTSLIQLFQKLENSEKGKLPVRSLEAIIKQRTKFSGELPVYNFDAIADQLDELNLEKNYRGFLKIKRMISQCREN